VNFAHTEKGTFAYVTIGGLNEVKVFRTDDFRQSQPSRSEISALGIFFEEHILVEEKTGEEGKARGAHRAGVGSNRPFPYLEG
jgi:hypothetical protein